MLAFNQREVEHDVLSFMGTSTLKTILQVLLLAVVGFIPFIFTQSLYFPYVSAKAYLFRILVAAALFFWTWLVLKDRSYVPNFKNILVVALVLFFLAQLLSSLFGVDPLYSLFGSIDRSEGVLQYGFWLVYFLMVLSVFTTERDWKILFSVFIIAAFLVSAYSWLFQSRDVLLHPELVSTSLVESCSRFLGLGGAVGPGDSEQILQSCSRFLVLRQHLSGFFGNPAHFAAFLLFAIGFCFLAVERRFFKSIFLRYLLLAFAAFFVFTLIFTYTRGALLAFVSGFFLFLFLTLLFLRRTHKKLAYSGGIIILFGIISLTLIFVAKDTDFVKERYFLSRITELADIRKSVSVEERFLNWTIALKAFKEKPMFGYGPENYGAAFNKYYDYRVGKTEPWFDRAHNQALDTLATGGIVVFSAYLFLLIAVAFLIFKIGKEKKLLSFILGSTFLAYFSQGFFLFDTLAVFLGLFPFLAYLTYLNSKSLPRRQAGESLISNQIQNPLRLRSRQAKFKIQNLTLVATGVFCVFLVYATAFVPWKANAAAFGLFRREHEQAEPLLKEAFSAKSPYTYWEVRKRVGWDFLRILERQAIDQTSQETLKEIQGVYDLIVYELEKLIQARPTEPQGYYVLARIYRLGYEKLGRNDLAKAEAVLHKGFQYSDLRVEYHNDYGQILLLEGKFDEAERWLYDYMGKANFQEYFSYLILGDFYFAAGDHGRALAQYEKAREAGYTFVEIIPEYSRYIFVAEAEGDYKKLVDMTHAFLRKWGPDADAYFDLAVGYYYLEESEKVREFFERAVELKPEYEEKRELFGL